MNSEKTNNSEFLQRKPFLHTIAPACCWGPAQAGRALHVPRGHLPQVGRRQSSTLGICRDREQRVCRTCRAALSRGVRGSGGLSAGTPVAPCSTALGSGPWRRNLCSGRARKPCSELLCSLPPPFLPTTPPYLKITILRKTGVILLYVVLFVRSRSVSSHSCCAGWWV